MEAQRWRTKRLVQKVFKGKEHWSAVSRSHIVNSCKCQVSTHASSRKWLLNMKASGLELANSGPWAFITQKPAPVVWVRQDPQSWTEITGRNALIVTKLHAKPLRTLQAFCPTSCKQVKKAKIGGAKHRITEVTTVSCQNPQQQHKYQQHITTHCLKLPLLDACGNIPRADQESSNLFEALLIHHASCHGATSQAHPSRWNRRGVWGDGVSVPCTKKSNAWCFGMPWDAFGAKFWGWLTESTIDNGWFFFGDAGCTVALLAASCYLKSTLENRRHKSS